MTLTKEQAKDFKEWKKSGLVVCIGCNSKFEPLYKTECTEYKKTFNAKTLLTYWKEKFNH